MLIDYKKKKTMLNDCRKESSKYEDDINFDVKLQRARI